MVFFAVVNPNSCSILVSHIEGQSMAFISMPCHAWTFLSESMEEREGVVGGKRGRTAEILLSTLQLLGCLLEVESMCVVCFDGGAQHTRGFH